MDLKEQLPPLIGMNLEELQGVALSGKMPKFVGRQLAEWLYDKKVREFVEIVNISNKNLSWIADKYRIGRERPVK
ncbi:MAG: 23S rRNA (adenine(2503)-C(2))-methyltransferase RlmN, partial [Muribaculaceae bacterium]|nr:23S rRNA (adenine(2503)-C(2))-methyltransferase RlmN [Muribaculaceae bacterium]